MDGARFPAAQMLIVVGASSRRQPTLLCSTAGSGLVGFGGCTGSSHSIFGHTSSGGPGSGSASSGCGAGSSSSSGCDGSASGSDGSGCGWGSRSGSGCDGSGPGPVGSGRCTGSGCGGPGSYTPVVDGRSISPFGHVVVVVGRLSTRPEAALSLRGDHASVGTSGRSAPDMSSFAEGEKTTVAWSYTRRRLASARARMKALSPGEPFRAASRTSLARSSLDALVRRDRIAAFSALRATEYPTQIFWSTTAAGSVSSMCENLCGRSAAA
mmetsp:Transcript_53030/g.112659  ORF Transcript_53030/g.112659 Transcript_53030/m.112659 type:complete len:268 (+) Transcript_53030:760-1563(+)